MGAEDPSLEQREDQMNARQHLGDGLIELRQHRDDVAITGLAEPGIAAPAVGVSGSRWPRWLSTKAVRTSAETLALRRGDLEDGAEPKGERLLALFEDR